MAERGEARRWPGGLLGMLALVAAVEAAVGAWPNGADPIAREWRAGYRAVRGRAPGAEVLCLGDSLIRFGVDVPRLERRLGRRVAGFARTAAPAAASYFALRAAVEAGARPRLVLVDYAPFLLRPGYRLNRRYLPEAGGLRDALDLAGSMRDPEAAGALLLGRLAPTVRGRDHIRGLLGRRAGIAPARKSPGPDDRAGLWLPNADRSVLDWFYPRDWECGPDHRAYVERLVELAGRHGATVAWLLPPIAPEVRAEWAALGLDARYDRFAAALQARFANLIVVDARAFPTAEADRLDPIHLGPRGAAAFTDRLADLLAAPGPAPRWAEMSPAAVSNHADKGPVKPWPEIISDESTRSLPFPSPSPSDAPDASVDLAEVAAARPDPSTATRIAILGLIRDPRGRRP